MTESTDKAIEKLTGGIEQLITAAQKVAPHAWETMVRQVILVNMLQVVVWVAVILVTRYLAKVTLRLYDKGCNGNGLPDREAAVMVACGIIGIALAITVVLMALLGGPATIAALLNPEYAAARELLSVLQ